MRKALVILGAAAAVAASSASAQLRVPTIIQRVIPATRQQQAPPLTGIDALRADFLTRAGADTVYFGLDTAVLGPPARATLAMQAQWIRQHPEVVVRIEGHGEPNDTRDYALAIGARRAQEVRDYLVLLGVPAAQLSTTSFGKERPGPPRAVTVLVR
jgi:peptidoglycan-associated lipoprotein